MNFISLITTDRIVVVFLGVALLIAVLNGYSIELATNIASGFVGYLGKTIHDNAAPTKDWPDKKE